MNKQTKTTRADTDRSIISGIDKHMTKGSIVLGGQLYRAAQLRTLFLADINAQNATAEARTKFRAMVAAEKATAKMSHLKRKQLRAYLVGVYGEDSEVLLDFGFQPHKSPHVKAGIRAQGVDKALATREARHTMGRKRRTEIQVEILPNGEQLVFDGAKEVTHGNGASPKPAV